MEFTIKSYESVGNIFFGTTRLEVVKILDKPTKSFKRNKFSINETDEYRKLGFFLNYDENDKVDSIEFYQKESTLSIMGIKLFEKQYYELLNLLTKIDKNIEEDETGFTSYSLGIGIYSPNKEDTIEGVIIFKKGYYDLIL